MRHMKGYRRFWKDIRHGSHQSGSLQNRLRDEWTCGMTLALAYIVMT